MAKTPVQKFQISKVVNGSADSVEDLLVAEEPLEIRLNHGSGDDRKQDRIAVTMRTPGNDYELATGFLFTEGIISSAADVKEVRYCLELKDPAEEENVVIVDLQPNVEVDIKQLERNFYVNSSCGVCGKSSIESVQNLGCAVLPAGEHKWESAFVKSLPTLANEDQTVFKHTGGLHAAVLFDSNGKQVMHREDVGRHNAVDKVVGALLASGDLPGTDHILFLSGRAGFELVQKCIVAGISAVASVGAPSSLAVELAQEFNLSLMGFVRDGRFNIYAGAGRVNVA